jgi:hypothetical protein
MFRAREFIVITACKKYYIITIYIQNLPEVEPLGSKHVEDKKWKIKILIYKMCILLVDIVKFYYEGLKTNSF